MIIKSKFYLYAIVGSALALNSFAVAQNNKQYSEQKEELLSIKTDKREAVIPLLTTLNEWVSREFIASPYLFVAPKDQLISPNDLLFVNERGGAVITVVKEGKIVAIATGVPFNAKSLSDYFQRNVAERAESLGWNPSKMFYVNYFLTAPDYRNDETIVMAAYNALKELAISLGLTHLCYAENASEVSISADAEEKSPIEPWGYVINDGKSMGMRIDVTWPTLQPDGSVADNVHVLEFFSIN